MVTFLSDYGAVDASVGVCHGVIARFAPEVRVIDLCHLVAPQDVRAGAALLAGAVGYLPVAVHLALVDPVAAVPARALAVRTADGATFVCPDNGVASLAWRAAGGAVAAHELAEPSWRFPGGVGGFRGRDVFAPAAARLAAGADLADAGPSVDVASLVEIELAGAQVDDDHVHAEVRTVDRFGNLALNARRTDLEAAGIALGDEVEVRVHGRSLLVPFTVGYGAVSAGHVAVCEGPDRVLVVAVNAGSASVNLRASRGDALILARAPRHPAPPTGVRIGVLDPPPRPSGAA